MLCFIDANITKTYLYNFDPLKPHFYIVKLGFTGVYIIFLISAQNIECGYSLEPPRRGGSNEYPQSMFWAEISVKNIRVFLSENHQFLEVKFSVYLNRRVFVMNSYTVKINSRRFYGWLPAPLSYFFFTSKWYGCVSLRYNAVAHIPIMSYSLPTLPYTVPPCVIITVNNLQAASCQYLP